MYYNGEPWQNSALCVGSGVNFFSEVDLLDGNPHPSAEELAHAKEETERAKSICAQCPVAYECITSALDNEDRFGVWGGADQGTIRKALSVDEEGAAVPRAKDMICPHCGSTELFPALRRRHQTRMQCGVCKISWWAKKATNVTPIKTKDAHEFMD